MSHYSDAEDSTDIQDIETVLRKRKVWDPETESITSEIKELLEEDVNSLLVEEDCVGCPLPSTPEDENILDSEMSDVLKAAVLGTGDDLDISALAHNAASQAEHVVRKMIQAGWSVCHFRNLPAWLQDNDFLVFGHRPPLPSFRACFKSIFRLHTETANIWTHLLGCVAFIGIAIYFLMRPMIEIELQEKIVFGAFFAGAIICLGCSFMFHTVNCHSQFIGKLFSKLDYCGIALLIMGSFVPWLYYGFYCHFRPKVVYLSFKHSKMWMAYASEHWTEAVDLTSSVQRLSSELKALSENAEHAAVYDLNVCYDEERIEWCLRDAENYQKGAEACNKFSDGTLDLNQLCEVLVDLNLWRFLYHLRPYLPEWIIQKFQLSDENRVEIEDVQENNDYGEEEVILDCLYVPLK